MASVRLNGDTSGFIEISAPNVAGSTTITLPATSGGNFLVTDSNGDLNVDSGTLFVDASTNRVGIGTTSPTAALNISTGSTDLSADFVGTGSPFIRIDNGTKKYIAQVTGSDFRIQDQSVSAERLRIDSSGRLLVGTATFMDGSGSNLLQVVSTGAGRIGLGRDDSEVTAGNTLGAIHFYGNDGGTYQECAVIRAEADGDHANNDKPSRLVFATTADSASSPTERYRIASNGFHFFNTQGSNASNSTFGAHIRGDGGIWAFRNVSGTFASNQFGGTSGIAQVMGDGDLENTNNRYTGLSDIKFKQNIEDSASQWDDLKAIRIRKYELKASPDRKHIGVIAQELEQVCPGLVIDRQNEEGETYKSVAYSVLYTKAVKALQEAMERIETLETANASLEARLTALEGGN